MKHIIIAGSPRAGKTTLALYFHKNGFVHYKMDSIKRAMFKALSLNIYDWHIISPMIASMISTIVLENSSDKVFNNEYYCIDTCHLYPIDIINANLDNAIVVFLGYPNINSEEKTKLIRKYDDSNIWTTKMDNSQLIHDIDLCIQYSEEVKKQCEELNVPFFDTSYDFNKTLDDARRYIENELIKSEKTYELTRRKINSYYN